MSSFPRDYPDALAGNAYWNDAAAAASATAARKARGEKPNYMSLRVASPYEPDWEALWPEVEAGAEAAATIAVVRSSEFVRGFTWHAAGDLDSSESGPVAYNKGTALSLTPNPTLVHGVVTIWTRGHIDPVAMVRGFCCAVAVSRCPSLHAAAAIAVVRSYSE